MMVKGTKITGICVIIIIIIITFFYLNNNHNDYSEIEAIIIDINKNNTGNPVLSLSIVFPDNLKGESFAVIEKHIKLVNKKGKIIDMNEFQAGQIIKIKCEAVMFSYHPILYNIYHIKIIK